MTPQEAPSWLDEPCPAWCRREHRKDDHRDDRRHRSDAVVVPAVVEGFAPAAEAPTSTELVVLLERRVGSHQTWVFIGEAEGTEHRVRLTVESTRRLVEAVQRLDSTPLH